MQGILLQIIYFERELSKSFNKDNFIFLSTRMLSACHSNVICMSCHPFVTHMYSYIIRISLVCTRMTLICHSFVIVCYPYVTRMYSYVIRISLVSTRMSSVWHSYVVVSQPYVTHMYSDVIRMSLVCTRMLSVCHSYVVVCHPYVTRMWFYHEPFLKFE